MGPDEVADTVQKAQDLADQLGERKVAGYLSRAFAEYRDFGDWSHGMVRESLSDAAWEAQQIATNKNDADYSNLAGLTQNAYKSTENM